MTSADIVRELRAATPVAPQALRLRVRSLEAPTPTPYPARRLRSMLTERRWLVIALPAAAAVSVVAGAVTGAFDDPPAEREAVAPPVASQAATGGQAPETGSGRRK